MVIKHLTKEELLAIYHEIIDRFGKERGVIDNGNLESTLFRVEGYHGKDEKDSIFWKATILLERIVTGHPFIDGNKRTGYEAAKTFLRLNNRELISTEEDTIQVLIGIAEGKRNRHSIKNWLVKHSKEVL